MAANGPARAQGSAIVLTLVAAMLLTMLLVGTAAASDRPGLRLGSDTWPPFTGEPDRQRIALELAHTALERAGIGATTTIAEWREVEAGLRRADLDGSAAMWHTEDRAKELLFSQPYLENRLVLVGRKGSDVDAARIQDLAGKRVAAVGRYAYGDEIDRASGVLFVNGRSDQESLDRLLAGEVEYMLVDELVARYLLTYQPEEVAAHLRIGTTPLARRTLHLAIRRDLPEAEAIIEAFDAEITGMLRDGTYAEVLQMGWVLIDVDGDGIDELVALGDSVGVRAPGAVYDVFGTEPEVPPEKRRVFIQGDLFEGWDSIPDRYKGSAGPNDVAFKQGTTLFTLQF